jgi:autotransporter adhesin
MTSIGRDGIILKATFTTASTVSADSGQDTQIIQKNKTKQNKKPVFPWDSVLSVFLYK